MLNEIQITVYMEIFAPVLFSPLSIYLLTGDEFQFLRLYLSLNAILFGRIRGEKNLVYSIRVSVILVVFFRSVMPTEESLVEELKHNNIHFSE